MVFLYLAIGLSESAGPLFRCLSDPTCKDVTPFLCDSITDTSHICDGNEIHCSDGSDEARSLCENPAWVKVPCSEPMHFRCQGHRPGQCVAIWRMCDGVYDCVDRSDESGCGVYSDLSAKIVRSEGQNASMLSLDQLTAERSTTAIPKESKEEESSVPSSVLVTLLFMLFAVPVIFVAKWAVVKLFVTCYSVPAKMTKKARERAEREAQMLDGDVVKMLRFIFLMVDHVEQGVGNEEELYALFSEVHRTSAWDKSAALIFDMGHLLFDGKQHLIDAFHIAMYEMEERLHGVAEDNGLELNLCLKHDLGNAVAYEMFYSVEPPCVRQCEWMIPDCLAAIWRSYVMRVVRIYFFLFFDAIRYYLDLIKDWIIFFILYLFVGHQSFWTLEMQLVFLLGIFLIVPELIRGAYFAHRYKTLLGIKQYDFQPTAEIILKSAMTILSPFVPAIILLEQGKVAFQILHAQKKLHDRIETSMNMSLSELNNPETIKSFKEEITEYHDAVRSRDKLLQIATDAKHLESSTETIFQYILQLMVVLVVANASQTDVTQGLEKVFFSVVGALLYISLILSFLSMIYSRMKVEKRSKQGYFRTKAKLLFALHSFICLSTKILSIVFFFAPSLGLFHLAGMYEKEVVDYSSAFVVDHDVMSNSTEDVGSSWSVDPNQSYTKYTLFSLGTYYVFFLVFVPVQCVVVYFIKQKLVPPFRAESLSLSKKILHVVSCITFPSIYEDWDIRVTEDVWVYETRWERIRKELVFMSVWHCCVNIFLSVPIVYCCVVIFIRNSELEAMGLSVLSEEEAAVRAAFAFVCMPIVFLLLMLVEYKVLQVYYHVGHPWARIFKEFRCNQKTSNKE